MYLSTLRGLLRNFYFFQQLFSLELAYFFLTRSDLAVYIIQIMDSFALGSAYPPRSVRTIDGISQVTTNNYGFKHVDIPCPFHADEQYSNYCTQAKCYQPLCSQCIEDHLILHKKHNYSDLGIKSMKGTRNNCIVKLGRIIEQLLKRLQQFQAPAAPEQQLQNLQIKLQAIKNEIHQIIEAEFSRIRQSLRMKLAQSTSLFKQMGQIHFKLEGIIEQLRQTHATLIDGGKRGGTAIPDSIRRTLSLDVQGLLNTFQNQAFTYEARRKKTQFDVSFQKEIIRNCLTESVKIIAPLGLNTSTVSYANKPTPRVKNTRVQEEDFTVTLPEEINIKGNISFLHFFETGSNRLHLIEVQNQSRGICRIVQINEFIVPAFHASLVSLSGQFVFLSGGIVELNKGGKSPMFVRYSVRSGTTKKDFARLRARSSHSLCQDTNGDVYILGGYGTSQHVGGDTPFQTTVERVNQRNGKVETETSSNWGGCNISALCRGFILKACEEGVQLYNPKIKQWIIADIVSRPMPEYIFFKNAGYVNLNESELFVFGGYDSQSAATDVCLDWKIVIEGAKTARVVITKLSCRLPIAEGFDSCGAMVDEHNLFVLQNIEDGEGGCLQNEKKLLRFELHSGTGDWSELQIVNQEQQ